ncbi:MAG: glycosyltransferase family 2 protein [Ignavibacteriales bacterium]|nr:glycosyltransferase family 2 protein [Ignavibacteriales bacterium]
MKSNNSKIILSIIIPARNEELYIKKAIDSIFSNGFDNSKLEIILVDAKSTDNTKEIVEEYIKQNQNILYFENEKIFTSYGLNIGIKQANGKYIMLFCAHSNIEKDYFNTAIKIMENEPEVACIGPKILPSYNSTSQKIFYDVIFSPFSNGGVKFRTQNQRMFVNTVAYGIYRKELFEKYGFFDEKFIRAQDYEFNIRIFEQGEKLLFEPKLIAYYYPRSKITDFIRMFFKNGFWKALFAKKHKKSLSIIIFIPALFLFFLIFSFIFLIIPSLRLFALLFIVNYLVFVIIGSLFLSTKNKFKYFLHYFSLMILMHISYGMGFLKGIFTSYKKLENKQQK